MRPTLQMESALNGALFFFYAIIVALELRRYNNPKFPREPKIMLLLICLVCVFSTFGGILLGQSLKGLLIFSQGLEKGQKKMFAIGVGSVVLALAISVAGIWCPMMMHSCPR
jgi:hypothetical protein